MPVNNPTPLDVAASIDRVLRRNIQWPVRNLVFADSPVTVSTLDRSIFCNAVAGAMVVNLPDATLNKGMFFEIKKTDASSNTVTIQSSVGGQTIDGAGAQVLIAENDFIVVESDGTNYKIVAKVISAPGGGGAVFYTIKKIYKTDGVAALNPVPGTLINFTVAVDGECFFAATGVFAGLSGLISTDLEIRVDGVKLVHSDYFSINGSGGDRTGPVTQEPCASKFLSAGPHTCELAASQVNIALQASPADPLTLSVLYPAASFNTAAPTPKAATLVVHPVPGVGDFTTIQAALAAIAALGGGYILVREGTYTPPVGGYIFPDAPVEIIGCGSGFDGAPATLIDASGFGPGAIFSSAFKKHRRIADLNILGDGSVTQYAFQNDVGTEEITDFSNVRVNLVQNFLANTAPFIVRLSQVYHTPSLAVAAKFWTFLGGAGGNSFIYADQVKVIGATIDGNPFLYATNSVFYLTNTGGPVVNNIREVHATVCEFAGEIQAQSGGSTIVGCVFTNGIFGVPPDRYLDFPTGVSVVSGCQFVIGGTVESIRVSGGTGQAQITGCYFAAGAPSTRALNLTVPSGANIANCDFHGGTSEQIQINAGTLDVTISGCNFTDDGGGPRAIDILNGAFRISIMGCAFKFFTTEAIRIAAARVMVVGCTGCKVVETAAANQNRYSNNDGFDPSAISVIGNASLIENENVREIDVNSVVDEFTRTVVSNVAGASITITLPTAASAKWRKYIFKKIDSSVNTVTIDADGAETIDGALTFVLTVQYQAIEIQSDGTQWWIV